MENSETTSSFPDQDQNFWQLASIQSSATGIPVMIIGGHVAAKFGVATGITSVIVGNLILWIIGMVIISMAAPEKDNALQNVMHYLGKVGSISGAIFLLLAFLSWYILELNSANIAISRLLSHEETSLRLGAGLGAFIALLSIGGIRLIKKYCTFIFPFLLLFSIFSIIYHFSIVKTNFVWNFSTLGIFAVISINLARFVNLPTFFRHSRSLLDSYLGLSLMIFFTMFFQISMILVGYGIGFHDVASISANSMIYSYFLIAFIILILIAMNLVNIYFASASWEIIFPHRKSNIEFVIIGLLGTLAYTFIQIATPMQFILSIAYNFIASLGIVLLLAFLIKTFEQHRPRPYEKVINLSCWFFGAIMGTLYTWKGSIDSTKTLIISICATTLAFLFIFYLEETIWSVRKIIARRKHE